MYVWSTCCRQWQWQLIQLNRFQDVYFAYKSPICWWLTPWKHQWLSRFLMSFFTFFTIFWGFCVKSEDFGKNSPWTIGDHFFLLNQDLQHLGQTGVCLCPSTAKIHLFPTKNNKSISLGSGFLLVVNFILRYRYRILEVVGKIATRGWCPYPLQID